jgi:trans-aconitate 2-methyltransferase
VRGPRLTSETVLRRTRIPRIPAVVPRVVDVGCGTGDSAKLLLERWPNAKLMLMDTSAERLAAAKADQALSSRGLVSFELQDANAHFSRAAAPTGPMYDLVFSNAALHLCDNVPELARRLFDRVRPGGALALQIPDMALAPSHALFRSTAAAMGHAAEEIRLPTNEGTPEEYARALLGPSCKTLDMWSSTYVHALAGDDAVYHFVRETFDGRRQAGAWDAALREKFGDAEAEAFDEAYRQEVAKAYPPVHAAGIKTTLYPFSRFFLVARRARLLE